MNKCIKNLVIFSSCAVVLSTGVVLGVAITQVTTRKKIRAKRKYLKFI